MKTNEPFVAQRDENGKVINFPEGGVVNLLPNRKTRRAFMKNMTSRKRINNRKGRNYMQHVTFIKKNEDGTETVIKRSIVHRYNYMP